MKTKIKVVIHKSTEQENFDENYIDAILDLCFNIIKKSAEKKEINSVENENLCTSIAC